MADSSPSRYVGRPVRRVNDEALLRGQGDFVDDLKLPGMCHAAVLRANTAHGEVRQIDGEQAKAAPGVLDLILPADASQLAPLPCVRVLPGQRLDFYPALSTTIRYVGQPLAVIVAETQAAAEDALELIEIDVEQHPPIVDVEDALEPQAPVLYPELGSNIVAEVSVGDDIAHREAAFQQATHVTERTFRVQRMAVVPLEPRGIVARWDKGQQELTVWCSTQTPHHVRDHLARCLRLPAGSVRVVVRGVGGGFGAKEHLYPDELLVAFAALRTVNPVKWIENRQESFVASLHARDQVWRSRLALDHEARFLAIDSEVHVNLGAHPSNVGLGPGVAGLRVLEGPYGFSRAGGEAIGVVTTTTPTGAFRGFGMQESTWVRERLVDEAARELGLDPVALRARNMVRPEEMPFRTRSGQEYDSGDYPHALTRSTSQVESKLSVGQIRRGVGCAAYVEMTGLAPSALLAAGGYKLHGYETAVIRIDPDGSAVVLTGTSPHGQGLETTLAQIAADRLGLELADVRVVFGDTAVAPYSATATIASRSMVVGGAAVLRASDEVKSQLLRVGSHLLEVAPEDLEVEKGRVQVRGTPARGVTVAEVATAAWQGGQTPTGSVPGLEARVVHEPKGTVHSYATHTAAVAVDLRTGQVKLEDYAVVHDCGVVVNPLIVAGQIHGGVAQGIGTALLEQFAYSVDGQPLTTTLLDYALPSPEHIPNLRLDHLEIPAPAVPGGMKGMGEGGAIGPAAAIGNAVAAAVPEIADRLTTTPLTPEIVWRALRDAGLPTEG